MKWIPALWWLVFSFALAAAQSIPTNAIDGTTGAPLGGIGCGAVKFCAYLGTFSGTFRTPCALDDFQALTNTQFQFYSKSGQSAPVTSAQLMAVQTGGRSNDDAVYPVHYANFGTINGVTVSLTAFSPVNLTNVNLMCWPYAFYQIQLTNTAAAPVDVAVAFQAGLTAATTLAQGKGIRNDDGNLKRAVYATSDDSTAIISAGNDAGFLTTGQCNNTVSGATNKVAAKVTLAAGQSKRIKFVYAWYNNVTGFEGSHNGMFYYLNAFSDAGAVADSGLAHFDQLRDNAVALVTRMRASNFPDWIKNQALVTLANLTNNSMYRQDGRYAHTEGMWATNGTMDQMFHARQIYTNLVPALNWQELHYWARTQKTSPAGQIHHDIDSCTDIENFAMSRNMAYMCPWDAQQHHDYREIDQWVDLNCAFVVSVYEAFISTADTGQLSYFWPYVKKAGQRLMDQLASYNDAADGFPYLYMGTQNSYDADGTTDINFYNSGLAAASYKALSSLSLVKADTSKKKYDAYYDSTRTEFAKKYLTNSGFPSNIRIEALMTGQWLAYFLKFGEMYDSTGIALALATLNAYYSPLTTGIGDAAGGYTEWAEYKIAHYAGLCLQTGKLDVWYALQYDWYQRIFNNRNLVYNIPLGIPPAVTSPTYLATSSSGYNEYISAPVIWRNYYTMVGYHRNGYSKELWLEPVIPVSEMNHTITNALVFSPEGWATVNYSQSGANFATQTVSFAPDTPVSVNGIYIWDKGLSVNYVKINGAAVGDSLVTKIGSGFAKELKINWRGTVPATGITVTVSDDPGFGAVRNGKNQPLPLWPGFSSTLNSFSITTCASVPHRIDIIDITGKTIGKYSGFGAVQYRFGAGPRESALGPGVYIAKVISGNTIVHKRFFLAR
ncbi:MAG: GH116 family glycosyl-hydrolase [Chitinivibrionales bacterium]